MRSPAVDRHRLPGLRRVGVEASHAAERVPQRARLHHVELAVPVFERVDVRAELDRRVEVSDGAVEVDGREPLRDLADDPRVCARTSRTSSSPRRRRARSTPPTTPAARPPAREMRLAQMRDLLQKQRSQANHLRREVGRGWGAPLSIGRAHRAAAYRAPRGGVRWQGAVRLDGRERGAGRGGGRRGHAGARACGRALVRGCGAGRAGAVCSRARGRRPALAHARLVRVPVSPAVSLSARSLPARRRRGA